jgi:ketosteroid isomerase-like protein
MRSNILLLFLISANLAALGCGGTTTTNTVSNTNLPNTNAPMPATNSALEPTKPAETATTNNAPTLGPVINAYYDALKRKDAAAVRKVMAEDFLKATEAEMKSEKKTDIVAFLTEFDKLPEGQMEVRNEQISGNRGTAIVKGGAYIGPGSVMVFKNEGGTWKVSNEIGKQ